MIRTCSMGVSMACSQKNMPWISKTCSFDLICIEKTLGNICETSGKILEHDDDDRPHVFQFILGNSWNIFRLKPSMVQHTWLHGIGGSFSKAPFPEGYGLVLTRWFHRLHPPQLGKWDDDKLDGLAVYLQKFCRRNLPTSPQKSPSSTSLCS
jgi:hypothetical protein